MPTPSKNTALINGILLSAIVLVVLGSGTIIYFMQREFNKKNQVVSQDNTNVSSPVNSQNLNTGFTNVTNTQQNLNLGLNENINVSVVNTNTSGNQNTNTSTSTQGIPLQPMIGKYNGGLDELAFGLKDIPSTFGESFSYFKYLGYDWESIGMDNAILRYRSTPVSSFQNGDGGVDVMQDYVIFSTTDAAKTQYEARKKYWDQTGTPGTISTLGMKNGYTLIKTSTSTQNIQQYHAIVLDSNAVFELDVTSRLYKDATTSIVLGDFNSLLTKFNERLKKYQTLSASEYAEFLVNLEKTGPAKLISSIP